MNIDLAAVGTAIVNHPILGLIILLCLGTTAVNGATDAPNAIATTVGTKAMKLTPAIIMAAICNFIGILLATAIGTAVASTIFGMVDFGGDSHNALIALAAAMVAIIVWGVATWFFGIPTSQSHSLVAGITGSAIALQGGWGAVNVDQWLLVVYGLVVSTVFGFGGGWLFAHLLKKLCVCLEINRQTGNRVFKWTQIISGAGVALLHGSQDGQKFLSLTMLGIMLGVFETSNVDGFPLWLVLVIGATMSLGTAIGGKKIIKSVGMTMVKMDMLQGSSACLSACLCIAFADFTGMPVSTTHIKTTAIMGVGAEKRVRSVKWNMVINMLLAWCLTFPGCGILAYAFTQLFLLFA